MNQEKLMKARMVSAIIVAMTALLSTLIFVGLYIDQSREVQASYEKQYISSLGNVSTEIETYLENKVDFDLRYHMVISEFGSARSFVFLLDEYTDEKKIINEMHYCYIKYPEQMAKKLEQTKIAIDKIVENDKIGYDEMDKIIESIDKMGN